MDEATITILARFGVEREEALRISSLIISSSMDVDPLWDGFTPYYNNVYGRMTNNIEITYLDGTRRTIEYRDENSIYEEGYQKGYQTCKKLI